ncbi:hypothetical protein MKZ38_009415 [Zalerion maritima]|uniref:Uncharacterized protein n=1 Tax=Zalerion maritima TaxID=339359 RepID=A0AAD5WVR5_9PEZI|nr:hypothetical protein MKZ38_009415 [Zalerion maritima]
MTRGTMMSFYAKEKDRGERGLEKKENPIQHVMSNEGCLAPVHSEDKSSVNEALDRVMKEGIPFDFDTTISTHDLRLEADGEKDPGLSPLFSRAALLANLRDIMVTGGGGTLHWLAQGTPYCNEYTI